MDPSKDQPSSSTFSRILKYLTLRAATLFLMVSVGIFLAIVVINYGGYIDKIHQAQIDEALNYISLSMPSATREELIQATDQMRAVMQEAYGLNKPFLLRCVYWWYDTMTFNWGKTYQFGISGFGSGVKDVSSVVLERLPYTLLLAGATNFLLFFASMFTALKLAKKNGSLLDRLAVGLSPLSAIPNWVYGIILTVIFAGTLHLLPFNGMFDTFPPATKLGYVPIVLRHMILPVTAIFLGMFFSTLYTWRTFFLIHAGEDYLEMAKAKGVPDRMIDRRYMLKPTLPYVITSFMILLITFWQGIIVLEVFFDWPGLGQLFMNSIAKKEMSVTIGIVTVFALLLGFSVFILDIVYSLVDPRVKIEGNKQMVSPVRYRKSLLETISSFSLIKYSRDIWQKLASGGQNRQKQPGPSYLAASRYMRSDGYKLNPARASSAGATGKADSIGYCPYLKLANNRGQALRADSIRCRCYVHDRPERVGSIYQAQVCRTEAYRDCPRLGQGIISSKQEKSGVIPSDQVKVLPKQPRSLNPVLRELFHYPLAVAGVIIIIILILVSIGTVIAIPYKQAVAAWAPQTSEKYLIPKNAMPTWVNLFRKRPLPPTIILNSTKGEATKVFSPETKGIMDETITYTVDYPYGDFPKDMLIIFDGQYGKKPFVKLTWITPDGRELQLGNFSVVSTQRYLASEDLPKKYLTGQAVQNLDNLLSGSGGASAVQVLFKDPAVKETATTLPGRYTLRVDTTLFEETSNLDAELIFYGKVYGLAGTDDLRRDLMVPLLWGIPVALAFGFFGAIATGILAMMIAAVGVWYGGWVDNIIQRITEINMILPTLPIAIMIYYLYSKSIWMILGIVILLSIFGSAIKTYRSAFLQVKEAGYIEAAQAYGASNWRIIRHYLIPRIIPLLIPQLVILVPTYVFFEATLAYLNVSDPYLPTWGKVIYDALTRGAFHGYYYWVLEPVVLMIVTALAFAVVGFALDTILNPRLRRM
jgi:peptide/nickel transport system permease protein